MKQPLGALHGRLALGSPNRRWLALIAGFDRRRGWSDSLTRSCAHWLNWQCGIDMGTARKKVRIACDLSVVTIVEDDGGETKLSNLVSLCRFHHRQMHEGRVRVERLDDGAWRLLKPSGEESMSAAPQRAERGNVSAATPG